MGLIDDLNKAAEAINATCNAAYPVSVSAIKRACRTFGVREDQDSYGKDLANVLTLIAERIGKEYVPIPLDADGKPVLDFLGTYYGVDGVPEHVIGYRSTGAVLVSDEDEGYRLVPPANLSKNPSDTQERIDADKRKSVSQYWGCGGAGCHQCPSKIDGLTPCERYGMDECEVAMGYDLALRQMKLDGRA